jgi:leucyl-tRNA synthetase
MTEETDVGGTPGNAEVEALERAMHQTIERVQDGYEAFSFNVALAALMEFSNTLREARCTAVTNAPIWEEALHNLLIMLAPIAPHVTEELWARRGRPYSIHQQPWPEFDAEKARETTFELVLQHNGKVRDRVQAPVGIGEEAAREMALQSARIQELLNGREPKKVIYVPERLVNVVG